MANQIGDDGLILEIGGGRSAAEGRITLNDLHGAKPETAVDVNLSILGGTESFNCWVVRGPATAPIELNIYIGMPDRAPDQFS